MASIEELQDVLRQSFERMLEILDHIDETTEIYPTWTVKEVIAHLIIWDKLTCDSLSSFIQGGTPAVAAINGVDAMNNEAIETYAAFSFEETVQEWEQERQRLLDTMTALTDKQSGDKITHPWGGHDTIARMLLLLANHDTQHTSDIIRITQS